MSGDVQPRKRKDKKKKRDDESSHGVHITKMGTDDVHLHIHQEHGTGGHWCAKVIFFSLMTILLGLVCLIILENRGIQDVDTPLSESRFSNYFNGWVDEHRVEHDDHHDNSHGSLENDDHDDDEHDDHEHDNEPFEEEVDHSEGEEEVADEVDENITPEEENEDENLTGENATEEEIDEDEEDYATIEEDNVTAEEEVEENVTLEDENVTAEQNDEADNDDVDKTNEEDDNITKETTKTTSKGVHDDEDDAFDEEDEDGNFDSLEKIVDNDAAEIELLKEKARQQAAAETKQYAASAENDIDDEAENAPSWASSLAVKIGVGLALALVARLVLLRKNPISNEEPTSEILMKRRLTIAHPDEELPEEAGDIDEPLPEDDYSEEEIEIEEEIEYLEEDEEPVGTENQIDAEIKPKTGGGPQSLEDDEIDLFEQELRRANDKMMRELNYH